MKTQTAAVKANVKRMQAILNVLGNMAGRMYSVRTGRFGIELQGEMSDELIKRLLDCKFQFVEISSKGYLEFQRGDIRATLTSL